MLGKPNNPETSLASTRDHPLTLYRHYVAFVRKQLPNEKSASWVLFNDEKVAKAADVEEMKKFAYVYFFRRL
jgi:uncharacterized UBP type Zn finger protein